MSFRHMYPPIDRPKAMFYFYSPLQTVFNSPTVSDTTSVSTTSTTGTTAKTYTLSIPAGADTIRVIIYGRVTGATGYFILNIDGVDVQTASTTSTSETIVIDYIGTVSPGTRTIRIDYYISATGFTVYLTKVYIATGIGVTSTTLTDIRTFSVTYQLLRSGDIRYSSGVRVFVYGNRKTTAPARLEVGSSSVTGRNQLGAGNDNDTGEVFLAIVTGSVTLQEGGEFTVSATLRGRVGASGDVIIITRVLARAQLRMDLPARGSVRIYERGVAEISSKMRVVPVPGGATGTQHAVQFIDILDRPLFGANIGAGGSDVTLYDIRFPIINPIDLGVGFGDDGRGESFIEWVQVVVWG
jgi:hypothetical protein